MLNIFNHTVNGMSFWLSHHTTLAYVTLFLGSYFETLIGPGFFIYGEAFFLPGAILAGAGVLNIWFVSLWLILGGLLGDTSSFFIGRHFGMRFFKESNKVFSFTNYKRGENFFAEHGAKSIFFARLLGPLSWITPFLAGTYKVPYSRFLMFNVPGVLIGIGEFLIVGFFFGKSYSKALAIIQGKLFIFIFATIVIFILYYVWKRNDPEFFSQKLTWKGFWRRYISKKV
ncbi:DedA family protein [bacterium]|nr:MAG: DedA family protein [bacterium]